MEELTTLLLPTEQYWQSWDT